MRRWQRGFSLIELLVSLVAVGLLLTLITQHFLFTKRHYVTQRQQFTADLELQLLSELLKDSVRRAGFTPCGSIDALRSIDRRQADVGLRALTTDKNFLQINYMDGYFSKLINQLNPSELLVKKGRHFKKQQTILIADCYQAEVQKIKFLRNTAEGTFLTLENPLFFHYLPPVYLGEWIEEEFFIQNNLKGVPALFYKRKHAEELSDLIKELDLKVNHSQRKRLVHLTLKMEDLDEIAILAKVRAG